MKLFFISLFLISTIYARALAKDSLYHVQFISTEDSSFLYFAPVKAMNAGIHIAHWQADINGVITIKRKEIRGYPNIVLTLNYPGFEKLSFSTEKLSVNDTVVIRVKPKPLTLDEIQIISYVVPLIDKSDKPFPFRHSKKPKKAPDTFPVYSTEQCLAYEALQKGVWLHKDTLTRNVISAYDTLNNHRAYYKEDLGVSGNFRRHFTYNIYYPKQATEFLMQETVYLSFELDPKGSVHYIKLLKGQYVDLVLEAANALAKMPQLKLEQGFSDDYLFPHKTLKPLRFIIPLKFILY